MNARQISSKEKAPNATRKVLQVLLVIAMSSVATWTVVAQDEVRAMWMLSSSAGSPEAARRAVASAVASGYTALLVPVSLYSGAPPAFEEVLARAHERGLRVYASLNVNLATAVDELPASRDHVIYQHPEWLMVPRELASELMKLDARSPEYVGRLARWTRAHSSRAAGLYVSPLHTEAAAYLTAAVRNVVQRFDVDGAQLEALEYPGEDFDYSRLAVELFRTDMRTRLVAGERGRMDQVASIDPFAYAEEYADEWRRFRESRLTALVTRVGGAVKAVRPNAVVSVGIANDAETALRSNLQDWRSWMDQGFVDAVSRRAGTLPSILFNSTALLRAFQDLNPALAKDVPPSR